MTWFKHDINCLEDDRFSALVDTFKSNGYAVFFMIVEELYRNEGKPVGSLVLKKIARRLGLTKEEVISIADYAASEDCEKLLIKKGSTYTSERVCKALKENDQLVNAKKEAARKRWEKFYRSNAHAEQMQCTCRADAEQVQSISNADAMQIRLDKKRLEENSSPSLREVLHKKEPTISNELVGKKEEKPTDLPANNEFSLTLKNGALWPISDLFHVSMQKAFPQVDVTAEFWKMVAKTNVDPKSRPTLTTISGFVRSWLSYAAKDIAQEESQDARRQIITDSDERNRGVNPDGTYTI